MSYDGFTVDDDDDHTTYSVPCSLLIIPIGKFFIYENFVRFWVKTYSTTAEHKMVK